MTTNRSRVGLDSLVLIILKALIKTYRISAASSENSKHIVLVDAPVDISKHWPFYIILTIQLAKTVFSKISRRKQLLENYMPYNVYYNVETQAALEIICYYVSKFIYARNVTTRRNNNQQNTNLNDGIIVWWFNYLMMYSN